MTIGKPMICPTTRSEATFWRTPPAAAGPPAYGNTNGRSEAATVFHDGGNGGHGGLLDGNGGDGGNSGGRGGNGGSAILIGNGGDGGSPNGTGGSRGILGGTNGQQG